MGSWFTEINISSWYNKFTRHASNIYPEIYTHTKCTKLVQQAEEIFRTAAKKQGIIVVHNYLPPEFHELVRWNPKFKIGDSLGLSRYIATSRSPMVYFQAVAFMAETAKMIAGNSSRVFMSDSRKVLGCSLVNGTDYEWLENWKRENPGGVLITYINSDPYTKSISDYISTSSNTAQIIVHAVSRNLGKKILILPDKFLGYVMKARAEELAKELGIPLNPKMIEVYEKPFNGNNACCDVHENIATDIMSALMAEHWDAWQAGEIDFMIHPECGCASSCMSDLRNMKVPNADKYFLSTEGMLTHAQKSRAKTFYVATETGMLYRLRSELPDKEFRPVASTAVCKYMKGNSFPKLLNSLHTDSIEIIFCNDCCDPKNPYEDSRVAHIPRSTASRALTAINRMLSIG